MNELKIGIVGIGDMGANIAKVLNAKGHKLVLYDRTEEKYEKFKTLDNIELAESVADMATKLGGSKPAVVWSMLPAGQITNDLVKELSGLLKKRDIMVDGSNSIYDDSISNYNLLKEKGIHYLDVGVAGGPSDLSDGVALMVGGDRDAFKLIEGIFKDLVGNGTYGYVGNAGAGQKAKTVHNIIFYGIFPIYAEGVELLSKMAEMEKDFDAKEAMRLIAASPPITIDIPTAMRESYGDLSKSAPAKVSDIVKWGAKRANDMGVEFKITNSVLEAYPNMSERSRAIYNAAKKLVTGH